MAHPSPQVRIKEVTQKASPSFFPHQGESLMSGDYPIELFTEHTPPDLDRILGYTGARRWVAFFWGKKIDRYSSSYGFDGIVFNSVNQFAWDAFFNHDLIVSMNHRRKDGSAIRKFEFGSENRSSEHWLLLDRQERLLYAARKESALYYLQTANDLAEKDAGSEFEAGSERIDMPAKNGSLQKIAEMIEWLDQRKESLTKQGNWPIFD